MKYNSAEIAIIGGGIVGLAHAYMALKEGYRVVLFEREEFAVGASVRNFGLLWPVGQEPGPGLNRALRSREHWKDVAEQAGLWLQPNGSLHLAYHDDEMEVLEEFLDMYKGEGYQTELLNPNQVAMHSLCVKTKHLKGGLWSSTEATVNPREAIRKIPHWLEQKFGLILRFGTPVSSINMPIIRTNNEVWNVERAFVCSGSDFETLFPDVFQQQEMVKCRLQMMKGTPQTGNLQLGPSLCAGLTLRHYHAFRKCTALKKVDERYDALESKFKSLGIHVLLAQHDQGDLIIGDSHIYGKTVEPFDQEEINNLIIQYLDTFADLGDWKITERWNGAYAKTKDGVPFVYEPEPGITIVNGLGGAGMTLSFGLAEEIIQAL